MRFVHDVASKNPALIIGAVVIAYLIVRFLRHNGGWVLLGAWTALCLSILLLPGGKATLAVADKLPNGINRAECVGAAVLARVPWSPGTSAKTLTSCQFRGVGAGQTGVTDVARVALKGPVGPGSQLVATFGR